MTNHATGNAFINQLYKRYHMGIDPEMPAHYYEYYTPAHIINAALEVMGEIDLDPCSNSHTEPNVPAKYLYTKSDNGLNFTWYDKVFMNPPYGFAITEWIEKLKYHYEADDVTEAILVLPASTGTRWFDRLQTYPHCFLKERLHFLRPIGYSIKEAKGATVIFYLGKNINKFCEVFCRVGAIHQCIHKYTPIRK